MKNKTKTHETIKEETLTKKENPRRKPEPGRSTDHSSEQATVRPWNMSFRDWNTSAHNSPGKTRVRAALRVSSPADPAEREADRETQQAVSMKEADISAEQTADVQASPASGGIGVSTEVESGINSLSGGQQLSNTELSFFGPRLGADFSGVRVHNTDQAHSLADSINARAFTRGSDIVFAKGEYAPGTGEGKKLLAHELVHVVQGGGTHPIINRKSRTDEHRWITIEMRDGTRFECVLKGSDLKYYIVFSENFKSEKNKNGIQYIPIHSVKNIKYVNQPKTAMGTLTFEHQETTYATEWESVEITIHKRTVHEWKKFFQIADQESNRKELAVIIAGILGDFSDSFNDYMPGSGKTGTQRERVHNFNYKGIQFNDKDALDLMLGMLLCPDFDLAHYRFVNKIENHLYHLLTRFVARYMQRALVMLTLEELQEIKVKQFVKQFLALKSNTAGHKTKEILYPIIESCLYNASLKIEEKLRSPIDIEENKEINSYLETYGIILGKTIRVLIEEGEDRIDDAGDLISIFCAALGVATLGLSTVPSLFVAGACLIAGLITDHITDNIKTTEHVIFKNTLDEKIKGRVNELREFNDPVVQKYIKLKGGQKIFELRVSNALKSIQIGVLDGQKKI